MSTETLTKNPPAAGALYDFLGFLTTYEGEITLGSKHEPHEVFDLLTEWAEKRGLDLGDADVRDWHKGYAIERAWGLLANAWAFVEREGGETSEQWIKAAERWRDKNWNSSAIPPEITP